MITKAKHYAFKSEGCLGAKIEDVDTATHKVAWVGNTYHFLDSDGDVLVPGVCKVSIKERGPESNAIGKIMHFINHDADPRSSPGKIVELSEKDVTIKGIKCKCLYGVTEMNMKTQLGRETLENYLSGNYNQHSIGFQYLSLAFLEKDSKDANVKEQFERLCDKLINPEEAEEKGYMCRVDDIKLYENSTVGFGANSMTPTISAKGKSKELMLQHFYNRVDNLKNLMRRENKETLREDLQYHIEIQMLQLKQLGYELFFNFKESSGITMDLAGLR